MARPIIAAGTEGRVTVRAGNFTESCNLSPDLAVAAHLRAAATADRKEPATSAHGGHQNLDAQPTSTPGLSRQLH
jgi:hypothetical protein